MPFSFPSSPAAGQQSTQNGRVYQWSGSAWQLVTTLPAHTHTAIQITDFTAAASSAAPVQSVAGRTGAVTIAVADVSGAVASNDARLSDTRTPTDGSVTDAKITSGGLSTSSLNWAGITDWAPSTAYAKGDIVNYLGVAYRRSAAGTSGSNFTSANWQQVTPSTGATSSTLAIGNHAHGNVTSDGKIGTTASQIVVTTTGGTLTTAATVTAAQLPIVLEQPKTIGNSGSATTLALTTGSVQTVTLSASCTFTMPTATAGASITLILTQGSNYTAAFTGVKWPGGTAPTITATANAIDVLVFVSDGTNWYGVASQKFS